MIVLQGERARKSVFGLWKRILPPNTLTSLTLGEGADSFPVPVRSCGPARVRCSWLHAEMKDEGEAEGLFRFRLVPWL